MKKRYLNWEAGGLYLLSLLISLMAMSFVNSVYKDGGIPAISPIEVGKYDKITSRYGMRIHPITKKNTFHKGIDFAARVGTSILATADGEVIEVQFHKDSYGKMVVIDHGNGYITRYAQMSDYEVKEGDTVKQGDVIGYVGESGISTGPHLHYEVLKDGENVDPGDFMEDL